METKLTRRERIVRRLSACAGLIVVAMGIGTVSALAGELGALRFEVVAPPAELKAPSFYTKYVDAEGYPILASDGVDDYALKEAAYWVGRMLAHRPDVRRAKIGRAHV